MKKVSLICLLLILLCSQLMAANILTIKSPSSRSYYYTTKANLYFSGTVKLEKGIKYVWWENDSGDEGDCYFKGSSWKSMEPVWYYLDETVITIYAMDKNNNIFSKSMIIDFNDITRPKVYITGPSKSAYVTWYSNVEDFYLSGTVTDNYFVEYLWIEDYYGNSEDIYFDENGYWEFPETDYLTLYQGETETYTVYAQDFSGNVGKDRITIRIR